MLRLLLLLLVHSNNSVIDIIRDRFYRITIHIDGIVVIVVVIVIIDQIIIVVVIGTGNDEKE